MNDNFFRWTVVIRGGETVNLSILLMTIAIAFLITVLISLLFFPFLKRLKCGQRFREEGPKSHMKKTGPPTVGGIMIVVSIVITSLTMTYKYKGSIGMKWVY